MSTRYLVLEHYETGKGSVDLGGDGSLSYLIYDNTGAVIQTKTDAGIAEYPAGSADYRIAVPSGWSGVIVWYLASRGDDSLASESFNAIVESVFNGPNTVTLQFLDADHNAVPNVTFFIVGIGSTTANGAGVATVNLMDGNYTVSVIATAGVFWANRTITVSGNLSVELVGSTVATVPPSTGGASGRGIKLHRYAIKHANHYHLRAFRIRIVAAEVTGGMDPDVFLFRIRPADPETGLTPLPDFQTVCSPTDLAEYPVGNPDPSGETTHFRGSVVELDVRSSHHYEETWRIIQTAVCELVAALNRMDNLVVAEETWCGRQPSDDSSASSASSTSSASISV